MKNPVEVLRAKEQELQQVKREIEALRVALPLLGGDVDEIRPSPFSSVLVPDIPVRKSVQALP